MLTVGELATMREMVTSPEYRHMSLGCLALFAQREGKLYAAPPPGASSSANAAGAGPENASILCGPR